MSFVYRELAPDVASRIMDICEKMNVEYDVWNADTVSLGTANFVELGLSENDWPKIDLTSNQS